MPDPPEIRLGSFKTPCYVPTIDEIMTVSRLKMDNRLEEVLDLSDRYVESVLAVKKNLQENHG